jgi:hypothetical protein
VNIKRKGKVVRKTSWTVKGIPIVVLMRDPTEVKLALKCFRGRECNCAGNFTLWRNVTEMFCDDEFVELIMCDILRSIDNSVNRRQVTLELSRNIGWSSTDDATKYKEDDLSIYHPNLKCTALRVKLDAHHLKAPLTPFVTVNYQIKYESEKEQFVVVIHSTYPGKLIGDLVGNVTEKRGIIFFNLRHPGE